MKTYFEVIIGTYEGYLLGYKLQEEQPGEYVFAQSFADKSHTAAIKCLSVHDSWAATGSTDDRIFIYDLQKRRQSNVLLAHEGTVNALAFTPDNTHLLSAGDDGQLIATRLGTWVAEATWKKAHNGQPVTHITCHPSGKLVLSLGNDGILRTWNLVKGRVAYKTNLKNKSTVGPRFDCLKWSLTGDYFTLTGDRAVEIWSIQTANVVHKLETKSKPICICWLERKIVLVGLENGQILWINMENREDNVLTQAHETRVKAMAFKDGILATASSCGSLKLWQVDETNCSLSELVYLNTNCRPICLDICDVVVLGAEKNGEKIECKTQTENKSKTEFVSKRTERGVVTIEYDNDEAVDLGTSGASNDDGEESNETESGSDESKEKSSNDDENKEVEKAQNSRKRRVFTKNSDVKKCKTNQSVKQKKKKSTTLSNK